MSTFWFVQVLFTFLSNTFFLEALRSKLRHIFREYQDSNPERLDEKCGRYLCALLPPLLIMFTFSLIQVPRVASAGVHHEAPVEGEVGQGSRLHAQDLHQDEETMGVPHLPVRPASPTSKSLL